RLTQAFITALTAQMPSGRLYEVDMRLRPSGRAGPVATSLTSFTDYQMNDAWTWEHLALTRASVLGTETPLENAVRAARCKIIEAKADWECTRDAIIDMRRRLAADMPTTGEWDLKRGEGGLQDIELTAQGIALSISCLATTTADQLSAGVASGQFDAAAVADLVEAHRFMSSLRMLHILMCSSESGTVELGIGARNRMMSLMNLSDDVKIEDKILHTKSQAAKAINTLLAAKES
ncbi:MAG: putative nucleotidyltransferase substrate binding domain-containing protein, partial [Planktomarina sp.]